MRRFFFQKHLNNFPLISPYDTTKKRTFVVYTLQSYFSKFMKSTNSIAQSNNNEFTVNSSLT